MTQRQLKKSIATAKKAALDRANSRNPEIGALGAVVLDLCEIVETLANRKK